MWGDTKQANSATTSLIYITLGSLIDVWTVVYWLYLRTHGGTDIAYLWLGGFFFTGIVLFLIGLAVGRIGSAARPAEVAPTPTAQVISPNMVASQPIAMNPNAVNAVAPAAPVVSSEPVYQAPDVAPAPIVTTKSSGQVVPTSYLNSGTS